VWRLQGAKRRKKGESNRRDDYGHKEGFGDIKKIEERREGEYNGGKDYVCKGSLKIRGIHE